VSAATGAHGAGGYGPATKRSPASRTRQRREPLHRVVQPIPRHPSELREGPSGCLRGACRRVFADLWRTPLRGCRRSLWRVR
jgi:hypothetical protein